MTEGPKCECCKTNAATLRLTEPTDASAPVGTLYCDYCSTATSASFERIEAPAPEPEDFDSDEEFAAALDRFDRIKAVAQQRDFAGEQALRSLARLKNDCERAEISIRTAMAGGAFHHGNIVLHHQVLIDPVTQGQAFLSLTTALAVLSR